MTDFIKRRRKKKAQDLRKGKGTQKNSDKTVSTHKMEWGKTKMLQKKEVRKYIL